MRHPAARESAASGSGVVFHDVLPEFAFHRPTTTAEALALLARDHGRAALLAGGTDLVLRMVDIGVRRAGRVEPTLCSSSTWRSWCPGRS